MYLRVLLVMKKIVAISLAFILLFSNLGFAVGTHYCGGEEVMSRFLLGESALSCGMAAMESNCDSDHGDGLSFSKSGCCENEYRSFQVDDNYHPELVKLVQNFSFAVAFFYTDYFTGLFPSVEKTFYSDYSPPPLEKDLRVLFQTFLI